MNKHDEAREYVDGIDGTGYFQRLHDYITDMEAMEKELNELKRDIGRYLIVENMKEYCKIQNIVCPDEIVQEHFELKEKLSKVGDEE
jgi:hypothetical protein